jgi:peptidoglycan/LPS O-acetylase OafA/YrhL
VFYSGLAVAAALLVADFLLLVRAQGTSRQLEIFALLFALAMLAVVYRYHSSNEQLKRLGARGVWFLILILIGTAVVFLSQANLNPGRERPAPAEPAPKAGE